MEKTTDLFTVYCETGFRCFEAFAEFSSKEKAMSCAKAQSAHTFVTIGEGFAKEIIFEK